MISASTAYVKIEAKASFLLAEVNPAQARVMNQDIFLLVVLITVREKMLMKKMFPLRVE
jgi:hypothetical protein